MRTKARRRMRTWRTRPGAGPPTIGVELARLLLLLGTSPLRRRFVDLLLDAVGLLLHGTRLVPGAIVILAAHRGLGLGEGRGESVEILAERARSAFVSFPTGAPFRAVL